MGNLQIDIDKYKKKPKKRMAAFEWQDRAAKVIKQLNVPDEVEQQIGNKIVIRKPKSMFFKWFKEQRSKAESSLEITIAKPRHTPWLYFAWLMTH